MKEIKARKVRRTKGEEIHLNNVPLVKLGPKTETFDSDWFSVGGAKEVAGVGTTFSGHLIISIGEKRFSLKVSKLCKVLLQLDREGKL